VTFTVVPDRGYRVGTPTIEIGSDFYLTDDGRTVTIASVSSDVSVNFNVRRRSSGGGDDDTSSSTGSGSGSSGDTDNNNASDAEDLNTLGADFPFVDVFPSDYYYDAVSWAVDQAITNGTDETHFSPSAPCTRAQAVTFIWRSAGSPEPTGDYNPFTDVSERNYYYKAVLWGVEQGIVKGLSPTIFGGDVAVSRAHIVTFLWRYAGTPSGYTRSFTDVDYDEYYGEAVEWAVDNGITTGMTATTFAPDNTCTRAQIVTFLYRFLAK
jgi:hypothetical protein